MNEVRDRSKLLLWSEQYRPRRVQDCILPDRMKAYFQKMVDTGLVENMTLSGGPGTGKTTVARAICEELGLDYILINASENGNIETIRTTVRQFGSTISFTSDIKVIILDEADHLTPLAQAALRGVIEEFAANCRFIFTANFTNRIIPALQSRNPVVSFAFSKEEKRDLVMSFDKRVKAILEEKEVAYEKPDLAQLIIKNFPDFRKTLNLLQRFSSGGQLTITSSGGVNDEQLKVLLGFLKAKEFTNMRKWVVDNMDNDGAMIRRALFDKATELFQPAFIPQLVLFISQYDERESRVIDKEINMVAFLTEVMADGQFK